MLRQIVASAAYGAIRAMPTLRVPTALEVVFAQGRLVSLLRKCGINCVLDVGAHHGWFAARLRRAGYRGHIFSFEPFPGSVSEIQRKAASDSNWSVLPYAWASTRAARVQRVADRGRRDNDELLLGACHPLRGKGTADRYDPAI